MFIRKNWLPLSVLLVAIAGIGLYMLATQPPPEPMKIYKTVEPKKPTQQPTTTQAPIGETSQGDTSTPMAHFMPNSTRQKCNPQQR